MPKAAVAQKPEGSSSSAEQTADPGKDRTDADAEPLQQLQHSPRSFRRTVLKVCKTRQCHCDGEVWRWQSKPGWTSGWPPPSHMVYPLPCSLLSGPPHPRTPKHYTSPPSQLPQLLPDPQDGGSNLVQASVKSCPVALSAHTSPLHGSQTQHSREPHLRHWSCGPPPGLLNRGLLRLPARHTYSDPS